MLHRVHSALTVRAAASLAILLIAIAASSCSRKVASTVDASLVPPTYPEGISGNSDLILYPDTPVRVRTWTDNGLPGPTPDDVLVSTEYLYESGPNAVMGALIDATQPSQFQVLRRHGADGYAPLNDFLIQPSKSWLDSQTELFIFPDPHPFPAPDRSYIARGVLGDQPTASSPLSNIADLQLASVPGTLQYLGKVFPDTTTDSLFVMKWAAVPGAAGYWITVYGYAPAYLSAAALLRSGLPHPLLPERLPEYFVGYIPAPATQYKLGDPGPPGTRILTTAVVLNANRYCVRICAVDAAGQLLDYTGLSGEIAIQAAGVGSYQDFPLGSVVVFPAASAPPPALSARSAAVAPSAPAPLKPGEVRLLSEWKGARKATR